VAITLLIHQLAGSTATHLFLELQRHSNWKLINIARYQILGNGVIPVPGTEKNQAGKSRWVLNDNTMVNTVFPVHLPLISNFGICGLTKTSIIKKK
jgi:hypothetical protein